MTAGPPAATGSAREGEWAPETVLLPETAPLPAMGLLPDTGCAWSAVVCAGGAGRRLGGQDKATLVVGGMPLLARVLAAASGAQARVVVGPVRDLPAHSEDGEAVLVESGAGSGAGAEGASAGTGVVWCREEPPGGGPVAAIAAGLAAVRTPMVAVLAADLPFLTGQHLELLRRGAERVGTDVAVLVDPQGRRQYLAAVWRTDRLRAVLPAEPAGHPVRRLFAGCEVQEIAADAWACLDCDDPDDLQRACRRAAGAPQPMRPVSSR